MFVGRKNELENLRRRFDGKDFEFVVIYGRRRVGKTALIGEFVKDKRAVFFTARETNTQENLELFSQSIHTAYKSPAIPQGSSPVYKNFDDALDFLFQEACTSRLVLVIDEFPYLAKAWPGISSALQAKIDHRPPGCKLFLILCGSSLSFMENQVLGYQSPLYGRRTTQYKIQPMDFFETAEFVPSMSRFDKACVYAMSGGIPLYAALFSGRRSLKENVMAHFLSPSGFLFEEPENLLKQELREPASCNALIREIASGTTRLGELASKTGFDTARVSHILKTLMDLGIVIKEAPAEISLKAARKAIYLIGDGLYQFWYSFIPPLIELVQRNRGEEAWKIIEAGLSTYIGRIFEEICKQFLWRENAVDPRPFMFQSIGRWWGNDPLRKEEAEIDLVAFYGKEAALFCECKWKNEKTGTDVLNALVDKSAQFNYAKKYYRIFSKSGFTASCVKAAKEAGNVQLTGFDEMC